MFELMVRPLETGEVVMHTCDNPGCVNPKHLRGGSQKENVSDCARKGRRAPQLSDSSVIAIYRLLELGMPPANIARVYDVSPSTIKAVKSGVNFSRLHHLYDPSKPRSSRGPWFPT